MIIDIHNHILPGIDDGSKNMEETGKMLLMAVKEGIQGIVATPHYEAGLDEAWREKFAESYNEVADYIARNNIPVHLYIGNEIFYSGSVIDELEKGNIKTINGTRYVLVEFPLYADYMYIERELRNLQNAGYWPIIAHVERYESLRNVERIKSLVNMNVYIQVNQNSVVNKKRWQVRHFCIKLMRKGLVHLLATDAHNSQHRKPEVKECLRQLDKIIGESYRRLISEDNPEKIVKGERIREYNRA